MTNRTATFLSLEDEVLEPLGPDVGTSGARGAAVDPDTTKYGNAPYQIAECTWTRVYWIHPPPPR